MPSRRLERLRVALRFALFVFYLGAGVLHLRATDAMMAIMPPTIPFPRQIVMLTGVCEFFGAIGLLLPRTRRWAGLMLGLYALCVWPANIYQALWHIPVPPLPDSWWYHGPRLIFQPVLIWAALFAGGVVDWPFRKAD
jgi:uncharacterized membrane protein